MRDLIVMIGFLSLLPISFSRPFIGFLIWTWFAIMNPHRETFGFAYQFNFNMIIALMTFIGCVISNERLKIFNHYIPYLMALFFLWSFLTCFSAIHPIITWDFFYNIPLKMYIFILMLFFLVNCEERMIVILWIVAISLGYYGASIGLVGIISGGSGSVGRALNFGPTDTMIQDRNHMAVALLMLFPIILFLHKYTVNLFVRYALKIVAFLSIATVIISYSRTGILCLFIMCLYYFMFLRRKIIIILVSTIFLCVSFMFMPKEWQDRMDFSQKNIEKDGSLSIRFEAWKLATAIANDNPLTGGGFRSVQTRKATELYPDASKNKNPAAAHSIYFEVLSDHGYVGLGLFLILIFATIIANFMTRIISKNSPEFLWAYDLATALQLSIAMYLVGGAALSLAYYDLFYIIISISAVLNYMVVRKLKLNKAKKKQRKKNYLT